MKCCGVYLTLFIAFPTAEVFPGSSVLNAALLGGYKPEAEMLNQGTVMIFTGICGALVVMAVAYYAYW